MQHEAVWSLLWKVIVGTELQLGAECGLIPRGPMRTCMSGAAGTWKLSTATELLPPAPTPLFGSCVLPHFFTLTVLSVSGRFLVVLHLH